MVLTAAELHAIYRIKQSTVGDNGERRFSAWISTTAAQVLRRLEEGRSQKRAKSRRNSNS